MCTVSNDLKWARTNIQGSPLSISFTVSENDGWASEGFSKFCVVRAFVRKEKEKGVCGRRLHACIVFNGRVDVFAFPVKPKLSCGLLVSSPSWFLFVNYDSCRQRRPGSQLSSDPREGPEERIPLCTIEGTFS